MSRSRYRLLLGSLAFLSVVPAVGCSDKGDTGGGYSEALRTYEFAVNAEGTKIAEFGVPEYVKGLGAIGAEGGKENETQVLVAVVSEVRETATASGERLCTAFKVPAKEAGLGSDAEKRLETARDDTRRILRDQVITAVINQIAAAPAEERDKLLERMGINSTTLQSGRILDSSGKAAIPTRGTQQCEDYERWLLTTGKSLQSVGDGLTARAREAVRDCETKTR